MNRIQLLLASVLIFSQSYAQTSLNFDGINDYVDCGNNPLTDITGTAITLEAWIYPTSFQPNIWQGTVISKNDQTQSGYMLRVGGTGQINFNFGSFGGWNELNSGLNVITLNTWQHIAGTYDGTTSRIYVNGVEVASQAYSSSISAASALPLYIGEDASWNGRYFPGSIDEVRIWNTTRSSVEINASMNDELCTTDPSLVVYYRFNDGVAGGNNLGQNTLTDDSGNGINGTLTNFTNNGPSSNWVTGVTLGQGMTNTIVEEDACETYTWAETGQTYTNSGNYSVLLTGTSGCDSTVTLDLNIVSPSDLTTNQTACDSYTWGVNGQTYTSTTSVSETLTTSQGCPYMHTLNVTINQSTSETEMVDICESYTWPVNGDTYSISGFYTASFTAQNGCDSTLNLDLNIIPSLTADISGNPDGTLSTTFTGQIAWYNCDTETTISGETSSTFTPTSNGDYAVIITDGFSCPDTSDCITVDYLGLHEVGAINTGIAVEPNPTSGQFMVTLAPHHGTVTIEIIDSKGKVLKEQLVSSEAPTEFILNGEPGVYFVRALTEYGWVAERVVKL